MMSCYSCNLVLCDCIFLYNVVHKYSSLVGFLIDCDKLQQISSPRISVFVTEPHYFMGLTKHTVQTNHDTFQDHLRHFTVTYETL